MEYKTFLIVLVLGVAIFSGCVENADKTVYFSEKYNETITLYADHTAIVVGPDYSWSGTWRIDKNELITTWMPFGNVHAFEMNGSHLIDKDNDTWVKK